MSLQLGKHYRICSGTSQQPSVVSLVNSVLPSKISRSNGRWKPQRWLHSFVAVPTDELLKTAQQCPAGNSKAGRFVRRRARQKAITTLTPVTKGTPSIDTDPYQGVLPQHKDGNDQQMAWLVSLVSQTSQRYNGILGCVVVEHGEWGHNATRGMLPDTCLPLKVGDPFLVIEHLAVAPALQHSGIGTALVQHVAATAAADGMRLVYTLTTDDYSAASKFWSAVKWQGKGFVLLKEDTADGFNHRGIFVSQTTYEYILLI